MATQEAREVAASKMELAKVTERIRELYDRIARRAYDIFEGGGRMTGRDWADWFQAESELLHPVHNNVSESQEALTVRAEVPGFRAKDLEISLEPRRLSITGKKESKEEPKTKKTIYCETCSDQILRVLDLPAEVDPEKVRATLKAASWSWRCKRPRRPRRCELNQ